MDINKLYAKFIECSGEISTDTRTLMPGSMFFAWKGEYADGNDYINEALKKGARYIVCDNPKNEISDRFIVVKNTITALQNLARHHRIQFDVPVIAIGGSNGKTTTKELLAEILKQQKDTIASFGSLNNYTGVPLTLLRINQLTDIVVLEMGANHIGEIMELCKIALPTHGLITNIGRDHIGMFGGTDAILSANLELYHYLQQNNGYIFVNKNDSILMPKTNNKEKTICYGIGLNNENGIDSLNTVPLVSGVWKNNKIKTQLTGEYNLENIIAAITVAKYFNVPDEKIISGIEGYQPTNNRSEVIYTENNNIIIKDFYNANRTSMELALDNLNKVSMRYPKHKALGIIGDMLELGDYSKTEHQAIIDYSKELGIQDLILVGPEFAQTNYHNYTNYIDVDAAIAEISKNQITHKCILLKASNGTNLAKLYNTVTL